MSLGVLSGNTLGLAGLGGRPALGASAIPGRCWDKPGFKACHAALWRNAQADCAKTGAVDFGGNQSKCIETMADAYAFNTCVPELCPEEHPGGTVEVGPVYSEGDDCGARNTVRFVQTVVGTPADGKWGPNSQNAYEKHFAKTGHSYYDIAKGCKGTGPVPRQVTKAPAPKPAPKPVPVPVVPQPKKPGVSKGALLAGVGILGALGVGGYYYGQKKGWFQ